MIARLTGLCAVLLLTLGITHADGKPPRVLMLTDSVLRPAAGIVASEMKGRAEVVLPSSSLSDTGAVLPQLDKLLGDGKWDLIHFNFGFADLRHIDPNSKSVRIMSRHSGGVRVTSPDQYEANLRQIVARLKKTNAKLIWASATPIVGEKYDHVFESGSEITYNEIAAKIMFEEKIPVSDLHAWVLRNVKKFTDPFAFKRVPIQDPIIASIEQALGIPAKPKKPAAVKKK